MLNYSNNDWNDEVGLAWKYFSREYDYWLGVRTDNWSGSSYHTGQVYWKKAGNVSNGTDRANIWTWGGGSSYYSKTLTAHVLPVFTLNDNACILRGSGTIADPYVLGSK